MTEKQRIVLIGMNTGAMHGLAPYYLVAYLQADLEVYSRFDVQIKFFDLSEDVQWITEQVLAESPSVVGYSAYCWNIKIIEKVAKDVRLRCPSIIQIVGGPETGYETERFLEHNKSIDFAIIGEGERTFRELLRTFVLDHFTPKSIKGIVYRNGESLIRTPPQDMIQNLDEIPSPFLSGVLKVEEFGRTLGAYQSYRGCAFQCSYCQWGSAWVRKFSKERVAAELDMICSSKFEWVWWCDAVFNLSQRHTKWLMEYLRPFLIRGIETVFCIEIDIERLTDEQILFFAEFSNNFILNAGLQSTNERALQACRRRFRPNIFDERLSTLLTYAPNIQLQLDLIYGLPEDDLEGTLRSLEFVLKFGITRIEYQNLMLLPGTIFSEEREKWGIRVNPRKPNFVTGTSSYSEQDMLNASILIIGVTFYNFRLFEGYWEPVQKLLGFNRSKLLQSFSEWFVKRMDIPKSLSYFQEHELIPLLRDQQQDVEMISNRMKLLMEYFEDLSHEMHSSELFEAIQKPLLLDLLRLLLQPK